MLDTMISGMAPEAITAAATHSVCLCIFLVLILSNIVTSRSIVKTLPGFTGEFPFMLETGYVGVDEMEDGHLFYYFIESQRSPSRDPLLLFHGGGPGCSGLDVLFYENGPLAFKYTDMDHDGNLPTLTLNPYSWTKGLNMIFLDSPIGTGFSYSTTSEGYYSDDYKAANHIYIFLQKWFIDHPKFMENQLYIGGESYAGILQPIVIQKILEGNEDRHKPFLNLKGYVLATPKTDSYLDVNTRVQFAHRLTLIPDVLYESAKRSCNGDFINIDPNNTQCVADVDAIDELINGINLSQVLEPTCIRGSQKPNNIIQNRRSVAESSIDLLHSWPKSSGFWCREYNYVLVDIWANDESVRKALHIKEGTKRHYKYCDVSINHTKDVLSSIDYHRNFSQTDLRALIYVGDMDMNIPHIAIDTWMKSLNLTVDDSWRPWFVEGQVAGYTERYKNDFFYMTYATVKGAGHTAATYKPKECYTMLDRWLAYYPI